jgi:hypothetical protein
MNSILIAVPKPSEREEAKFSAWTSFVHMAGSIRLPLEGVRKLGDAVWLIENDSGLALFGQIISLATNAQIAVGLELKVFFVEQWTQWTYSANTRPM